MRKPTYYFTVKYLTVLFIHKALVIEMRKIED